MTPAERAAATHAAYQRLLHWHNAEAQLVWADLAAVCHVGEAPPSSDPLELARREGRRSIFLYIAGRVGLPLIPEA